MVGPVKVRLLVILGAILALTINKALASSVSLEAAPPAYPFQRPNSYPSLQPRKGPSMQPSFPYKFPTAGPSMDYLSSGTTGTHHIQKVTEDGHYLILDDGSVWKSNDESESSSWSDGDEVFVKGSMMINLSEDGEKIDAYQEGSGYTILADTYVDGEFEGADKPVKLSNGMIFELTTYHYQYSYHPEAIVLGTIFRGYRLYKIIIDDEIYSATRLR